MATDTKLKLVQGQGGRRQSSGQATQFFTKDQSEVLRLLSEIPEIARHAAVFATFVNPYDAGSVVHYEDQPKKENSTLVFTVIKGSVEVGRFQGQDKSEFLKLATLYPRSKDSAKLSTVFFSPNCEKKRLSIRALEDKTLVLMLKEKDFRASVNKPEAIEVYRKGQEQLFYQIASNVPEAKPYRLDVFLLRHITKTLVSDIKFITVAKLAKNIEFLNTRLTQLLEDYAKFKSEEPEDPMQHFDLYQKLTDKLFDE